MDDKPSLLTMRPLNGEEFHLFLHGLPRLEELLDITYRGDALEGPFREIVQRQLDAVNADQVNALYHTFWLMLREADRVVVGSACFKGPPDGQGRVEIGYGTAPPFQGKGYATLAVEELCRWALDQPGVTGVIAETETGNTPSHKVLHRNGFIRYTQEGGSYWWALDRQRRR